MYCDRKQLSVCPGMVKQNEKEGLQRISLKLWRGEEYVHYLNVMLILWIYKYVKTYQVMHFKSVQLIDVIYISIKMLNKNQKKH